MAKAQGLDCLIVPFGMSPADEIQAINAALQERGLDASNIISVRATGTPKEGVMVYFRHPFSLPFPNNKRCEKHSIDNCPYCIQKAENIGFCSDCNFEMHQVGGVLYCANCMAEEAQVK